MREDFGVPVSHRIILVLMNRLRLIRLADTYGHWKADVALNVWDDDDFGTPDEMTTIAHSVNEHNKAFNKVSGKSGGMKSTGKKKDKQFKRSSSSSSSSSSSHDRGEEKKRGSK